MTEQKTMPRTTHFFKKVVKDPLLHFIVLGGVLFGLVSLGGGSLEDGGPKRQNEIVITKAMQQHLADVFTASQHRPPTAEELKNLIDAHIKDEVFYREALALGLDRNDIIVRRRMRQKLEFLQEDVTPLPQPTEAELKAYYTAHKDRFKTDHILSFEQVVVSSKKLSADNQQLTEALSRLQNDRQPKSINRSDLLPISIKQETEKSILTTFGDGFVRQISDLPLQKWHGPVYSGFGTHVVKVSLNQAPTPLAFEQAKQRVLADYMEHQRTQAQAEYYKKLRSRYHIAIEKDK